MVHLLNSVSLNFRIYKLSNNNFTCPIPPDIGNLTELQHLDFSSNKLTAAIPDQVSHLQTLRTLNLSDNQLGSSKLVRFFPYAFSDKPLSQ